MEMMAYEVRPAINALVIALRPLIETGDFIVFRDAFRWKRDTGDELNPLTNRGSVINNGYEMFPLESIAEMLGAEIIWDYLHVGVLRPKPTTTDQSREG